MRFLDEPVPTNCLIALGTDTMKRLRDRVAAAMHAVALAAEECGQRDSRGTYGLLEGPSRVRITRWPPEIIAATPKKDMPVHERAPASDSIHAGG
jgi:hypothetical protein